MDFISFVNSKDIRDYLLEIDYKCDPMQAAWLVYQNHDKTYEEKHEAWQWIIDNMPDCEMPKRRFSIARPSLHAYLKELMEYRDKHKKRILKGKYPKRAKKMTEEEWDLYEHAFESRWFSFPTPFKKGDIVYDYRDDPHCHDGVCRGTFVLDDISDTEADMNRAEFGDTSDMNAYGWYTDYDGTIYKEVMFNYMDLVRFTGELKRQERVQIALSNYLKGEISIELLLQSQRTLQMREYGDEWLPNWYTDEGLELAGIYNLPRLTKKDKKKSRKRRKKIQRWHEAWWRKYGK